MEGTSNSGSVSIVTLVLHEGSRFDPGFMLGMALGWGPIRAQKHLVEVTKLVKVASSIAKHIVNGGLNSHIKNTFQVGRIDVHTWII